MHAHTASCLYRRHPKLHTSVPWKTNGLLHDLMAKPVVCGRVISIETGLTSQLVKLNPTDRFSFTGHPRRSTRSWISPGHGSHPVTVCGSSPALNVQAPVFSCSRAFASAPEYTNTLALKPFSSNLSADMPITDQTSHGSTFMTDTHTFACVQNLGSEAFQLHANNMDADKNAGVCGPDTANPPRETDGFSDSGSIYCSQLLSCSDMKHSIVSYHDELCVQTTVTPFELKSSCLA